MLLNFKYLSLYSNPPQSPTLRSSHFLFFLIPTDTQQWILKFAWFIGHYFLKQGFNFPIGANLLSDRDYQSRISGVKMDILKITSIILKDEMNIESISKRRHLFFLVRSEGLFLLFRRHQRYLKMASIPRIVNSSISALSNSLFFFFFPCQGHYFIMGHLLRLYFQSALQFATLTF